MLPDQDPRSENHHSKETFFFFLDTIFLTQIFGSDMLK